MESLGLLSVFATPLSQGRRQLRAGIQDLRDEFPHFPADDAGIEAQLLNHLLSRLKLIAERTLALELQVARIQGQLVGDTSAARFDSYVKRLQQPEVALALLTEYPVLAQQALNCIDQWVRFSLAFLRHLCSDWSQLKQSFALPAEISELVEIKGDAGDRHADGKAVLVLRFDGNKSLVYKPRSLAAEQRFQELLAWCNERGATPTFRTLRVIDGGDHGWVEFVERQDCRAAADLRRFYRRQGHYLALLYVMQATDFHFENLVAAGEHPVLVDLETLFHERLPGSDADPAIRGMSNSAVSIGILPRVSYFDGFDKGVDFSGLGASIGQEVEVPTYEIQSAGTDEMRLGRVEMHVLVGSHRPTLAGADVSPGDYGSEVLEGFAAMYQLIRRCRDELAAPDGPLAAFAQVETRFIARATQIYGILLEQSFHPDFLRNASNRDHWFDQLWSQAKDAAGLEPLVAAERADLERNDIPLFHSRPGSVDLWTSRGERIANFFSRTPLDTVHERLARMGPDDLARQTWLIHAAMAKLPRSDVHPAPTSTLAATQSDAAEALAAAINNGEQLAALAWQDADEAGWLGIQYRERGWFVEALGLDEDGLPGVVTFLADLDAATGQRRYASLVAKTIHSINHRLADPDEAQSAGLTKRLYNLARSTAIYDDAALQIEIARAIHLAVAATIQPPIGHVSPIEGNQLQAARTLPGVEVPGLHGGLAGKGRKFLQIALAARKEARGSKQIARSHA